MKKVLLYLLPTVFLFLSAATFGFYSSYNSGSSEKQFSSPTTFIKDEVFTETPGKYKISSHQGHVALFEIVRGKEVLLETYETPLSSLRARDAELLREGILFQSPKDAAESLENFIN